MNNKRMNKRGSNRNRLGKKKSNSGFSKKAELNPEIIPVKTKKIGFNLGLILTFAIVISIILIFAITFFGVKRNISINDDKNGDQNSEINDPSNIPSLDEEGANDDSINNEGDKTSFRDSGSGGGSGGGGGEGSSSNSSVENTVQECVPSKTCFDYPLECGMNLFDGCNNILDCSTNNCYVSNKTCDDVDSLNCIEIDKCGFYNYRNAYLLLNKSISDPMSCLFLGGNITLDLNVYSVKYLDGNYEHVNNYDFENWTYNGNKYIPDSWDVSLAPNAIRKNTINELPLIGNYLIYVPARETIVSDWVYLPVANRTYRGMIVERRIGSWGHIVNISVEDSRGNIVCKRSIQGSQAGSAAFCNFNISNSGNYRLRITTNYTHYFDYGDIVPALDVGIGSFKYYTVVGGCYNDGGSCYSPDYIGKYQGVSYSNITIVNGDIESGFDCMRTYGVHMASLGKINVDNIKINTKGIAAKIFSSSYKSEIKNSEFYNYMPWVIDRGDVGEVSINLGSNSVFLNNIVVGGQGLINPSGTNITISGNLLRNSQTVTNHYAINSYGDSNISVYNNIFDPISGSGILISTGCKDWRVFNNTFNVKAQVCDAEYIDGSFSTNAIRMTDYNKAIGSSKGSYGNYVYNNTFNITGKYYSNYPDCIPIANGIFYSVGAGNNYIENNTFYVYNTNVSSMAYAFYIGRSNNGGIWRNNYVKSNEAIGWISNIYGLASNSVIENNVFEKEDDTLIRSNKCKGYTNFKFGYCCGLYARNISFINNYYINTNISQNCYYSNIKDPYSFLYKWHLNVFVRDSGIPISDSKITAKSNLGEEIIGYTNENGFLKLVLTDFNQSGTMAYNRGTEYYTYHNPYNITVSKIGYDNYSFLFNITNTTNLN